MANDARVRFTKMEIRKALLTLLRKKSIKQITVKEVCEIAQINRATFYKHYSDVYDLLDQIQNELYAIVVDTMKAKVDRELDNIVLEVLHVIYVNDELCKVLFSENGDKAFFRKILDVGEEPCVDDWRKKYPDKDTDTLRLLYIYIANGSISLINNWVNSGMKESPEAMGRKIGRISLNAVRSLE